ncbi:RluA family pseudouridine synthase [Flammeovirga kamogawensis]|uniref:RluA family pseudouridine synthase n=1 Tax=Flammeovirga kamogawensis TaxID=373891 RepID=A0ABX8GZU5_9BACT|nr:RluA family pseudouridine synthase [Flammeovirga kamogawensis]MBB6459129.1 tRNA pseudouridine65 synthase/23S rRNA pseudouridine1911/1915/1917 synthase [Flammeovirga kamogawensis]QWG08697.1 RluA family pseudouridine synthase [Flammeovirga kamogawensis]TRX66990.1 RluA family pseudouridine synthase [Flammeovirga kamogawensis]
MNPSILSTLKVNNDYSDKDRVFDYILKNNTIITSRNGLKKAFKKGRILLNDTILNGAEWCAAGDIYQIFGEEEKVPKIFELSLNVLYEDDDCAVIYKPAGFSVSGNQFRTIENALLYNIKPSDLIDKMPWPKPCHRLDAPTSGVLLIAKTRLARVAFGQQFENKTIKKKYHAVVMGKLHADEGDIRTPIENKESHSSYKVIETVASLRSEQLSIVELTPHTGRTHQLRIHMASLGTPIVGDKLYGIEGNTLEGKGLFLSSVEITFKHPRTLAFKTIKAPQPEKFEKLLIRETKMWNKFRS